MELKDFVEDVLTQITEGAEAAQEKLFGRDVIINPPSANGSSGRSYNIWNDKRAIEEIDFEVALTATQKEGNKVGVGVFFGGLTAGITSKNDAENVVATKIKFKMQIILPAGKYDYEKFKPKIG